ncbi:MAG: hypothetical protein AAFX78_18625 [Cyanobacteria bacterium J06638_20]
MSVNKSDGFVNAGLGCVEEGRIATSSVEQGEITALHLDHHLDKFSMRHA